jgi:CobQ-like glutamine amidotransferase family enzyme
MGDTRVDGLGILDIRTERGNSRMIGNVAIQTDFLERPVVGFENHGGATQTGSIPALGKVIFGFGNNGEDGKEGVRYKNIFGTYLHGPLLPKNPHLCDYILDVAIKGKWPEFEVVSLNDELEWEANEYAQNLMPRIRNNTANLQV